MSVALVTGAGSGIGRAVALRLLSDGYQVFVTGRNLEPLEQTVALAKADGPRAAPVRVDVSDPASVNQLFDVIGRQSGRLDVVFNNAGTNAPAADVDEVKFGDWSRVIATNLTGAFLIAQGAFRMMRYQDPQGGRIINNGSVAAQAPRPRSVAYTASKAAITGMTKSLSLDGRRFGIACGQIDVGNAATEMAAQIARGVAQADGSIRAEPTIDPVHVADAVALMAGMPLGGNVQFITVMATAMPLVGRG